MKPAVFHPKAKDAIRDFPEDVRREFGKAIFDLRVADSVLIFHAFHKKTQKTPLHEVALAQKRLKEILYEES